MFYQPLVEEGHHVLDEDESAHCARVLRKREGDTVEVRDGKGHIYQVRLTAVHHRKCAFDILHRESVAPDNFHIHLAIAPTKNTDRIEWMVEKCVEIGLHEITFLTCDHSERSRLRFDRLHKKAISAMKQSRRAYALTIHPEVVPFDAFINTCETPAALAHVSEERPHMPLHEWDPGNAAVLMIGPEGDFSSRELAMASQQHCQLVSLGKNRLRTETAGLIGVHTLLLHFQ